MSDPYTLPTDRYAVPEPLSAAEEARAEAAMMACWEEIDPDQADPDGNAAAVATLMQERHPALWERMEAVLLWEGLCARAADYLGGRLIDGPGEAA